MSKSDQILAAIIDQKLKSEGYIKSSDDQLALKLASGQLKDVDWKLVLEEILNQQPFKTEISDEFE